ncbi:MAG: hypothetical protein KF718_02570 [Polyangiaceae bacterium]|nr:hypothetical protein [Polyangiaceae bacterium]
MASNLADVHHLIPLKAAQPVRRMRARRLKTEDVHLGDVRAVGTHSTFGKLAGQVEDLSLHGLSFVVQGGARSTGLVLVGDRLERFRVESTYGLLYRGTANVRRAIDRDGDLVIGLELEARGIDLAKVYHAGSRSGVAERMKAAVQAAQGDRIFGEYKAWVADLRSYLVATKSFLDSEQQALADMDQLTREQTIAAYISEVAPVVIEHMNQASHELTDLASRLSDSQHAHYRAYYRTHLHPLMRESPILRRSFEKPLGYAGDYEMMNMLYRDPAEGESLFGSVLNMYAVQEAAAQANINRLEYLGRLIREALASSSGRLRVASIGCGPGREISKLLDESPELGARLDIALVDQEERALAFCERTVAPLAVRTGARVQVIKESVRRLLTTKRLSAALGEREFIYSAGLFDYLNQRTVGVLMPTLYEALVPGGSLAIGNVAAHNPTRHFMEYCLDWFLIHRTPAELLAFAEPLAATRVEVDAEPLGVNLFLRVWK